MILVELCTIGLLGVHVQVCCDAFVTIATQQLQNTVQLRALFVFGTVIRLRITKVLIIRLFLVSHSDWVRIARMTVHVITI